MVTKGHTDVEEFSFFFLQPEVPGFHLVVFLIFKAMVMYAMKMVSDLSL